MQTTNTPFDKGVTELVCDEVVEWRTYFLFVGGPLVCATAIFRHSIKDYKEETNTKSSFSKSSIV